MDNANIKFRALVHNDSAFEKIAAIHRQGFDRGWTIAEFKKMFLPTTHYLGSAMEFNGTIVGFSVWLKTGNEAEIISIAIDKKHQQSGFGAALLKYDIETLTQKGANKFFLEVNEFNLAAQKLYKKFNFIKVGVREKYYTLKVGKKADAFVYLLKIC